MTATWMRFRSSLRTTWPAMLSLALLFGLSGGAVLAAAAGGRRTDSAYPRFLDAMRAADVLVPIFPWMPIGQVEPARITALPSVRSGVVVQAFVGTSPDARAEQPAGRLAGEAGPREYAIMTSTDPAFGTTIARHQVLEGRAPDPRAPDEISVGFSAVEATGLSLGSTLEMSFPSAGGPGGEPGSGPPVSRTLRVVGIVAAPDDFPPVYIGTPFSTALRGTPALHAALTGRAESLAAVVARLDGGQHAVGQFQRELSGLAPGAADLIIATRDHSLMVRRSIHLQAIALWLLAALLGVVALLAFAQLLSRHLLLSAIDHPAMRAIGMTGGQLWALSMIRALAVAIGGAALAVVVAIVASPLTPVGIARTAEPAAGVSVDVMVLGLGSIAMIVLTCAIAAWPARRAARRTHADAALRQAQRSTTSSFASLLARIGFGPSATIGARMALEPGGRSDPVPVRTGLTGVAVGLFGLVVALTFSTSLGHLLATPDDYGWSIDVSYANFEDPPQRFAPALRADARIDSYAFSGGPLPLVIGGLRMHAMVADATGTPLTLLSGRLPHGRDAAREIAVGSSTLRGLGIDVGERVRVTLQGDPDHAAMLRVVGHVVFPPLSPSMSLGKGAIVHPDITEAFPRLAENDGLALGEMIIRFEPGVDREAVITDLQRLDPTFAIAEPVRPDDLVNFGKVEQLPLVATVMLAGLAAATLAHMLVTSVRRRRRDLAILKALGFSSGQLRRTVWSQAATISSYAMLAGIPTGIAVGRWAWTVMAEQLGAVPRAVVPVWGLLASIPITFLLARLIAAMPGHVAARTRVGVALRAE